MVYNSCSIGVVNIIGQNLMIGSALFGFIMMLLNIYSDYREQKKRKEKNQEYLETYDKVVKDKEHKKQQEI